MPPRKHFEGTIAHIASVFTETLHVSDRVAAISCAALLDDTLGAAIAARFIKMGKDWEDRIFIDHNAPLGTFASKIVVGYAMGLFGPLTRANLDRIRSIRNDFAHSAAPVSFDAPVISNKCNQLTVLHPELPDIPEWIRGTLDTPRNRYIGASQWIAIDLSIRKTLRLRATFPDFLR